MVQAQLDISVKGIRQKCSQIHKNRLDKVKLSSEFSPLGLMCLMEVDGEVTMTEDCVGLC